MIWRCMKAGAILCLLMLTVTSTVFAAQWYVVKNETGECGPFDSPAKMIRISQEDGDHYKVIDEKKENNVPVIVVVQFNHEWQVRYFKTLKLCKNYLHKKRKSNEDIASKYE